MDKPTRLRRALSALAATTFAALLAAGGVSAHPSMSPPIVKAKASQQFTLAVPTEKEGLKTVRVELTPPSGLSIDAFEPSPGWKRAVEATGSGEEQTITRVTWSGAGVPTSEDAVFRFVGELDNPKDYAVEVRQTYSDGSVEEWTGNESSDTPAPVVKAVSSLGGGSSSTLSVIALVVAAVAILIAVVSLAAGKRSLT